MRLPEDFKDFLKAFPEAKYSFVSKLKVALEKTWEIFLQNKAVPSFRKRLIEYLKASIEDILRICCNSKRVRSYDVSGCLLERH